MLRPSSCANHLTMLCCKLNGQRWWFCLIFRVLGEELKFNLVLTCPSPVRGYILLYFSFCIVKACRNVMILAQFSLDLMIDLFWCFILNQGRNRFAMHSNAIAMVQLLEIFWNNPFQGKFYRKFITCLQPGSHGRQLEWDNKAESRNLFLRNCK